jgi:hypothetical protein
MSYLARIVPVMEEDLNPCNVETDLTRPELEIIEALPDGAHETSASLGCELEAGHPGPHLSLAQAYGAPERARWLQWDDGSRNWLDIEDDAHCYAEGPPLKSLDENAMCLLPGTHPGRHTFEFGVLT